MDYYTNEIKKLQTRRRVLEAEKMRIQGELGVINANPLHAQRESLEHQKSTLLDAINQLFSIRGALRKWKKAVDRAPALAGNVPIPDLRTVAKDPAGMALSGPGHMKTINLVLAGFSDLLQQGRLPFKQAVAANVLASIEKIVTQGELVSLVAQYQAASDSLDHFLVSAPFHALVQKRQELDVTACQRSNEINQLDDCIVKMGQREIKRRADRSRIHARLQKQRTKSVLIASMLLFASVIIPVAVWRLSLFLAVVPTSENNGGTDGGSHAIIESPHYITFGVDSGLKVGIHDHSINWADPHETLSPNSISVKVGNTYVAGIQSISCREGAVLYVKVVFHYNLEDHTATGGWAINTYANTLLLTEVLWYEDGGQDLGSFVLFDGPRAIQVDLGS